MDRKCFLNVLMTEQWQYNIYDIWTTIKGCEYYSWKSALMATNAASRQNSVCSGTSLSMRSFAIEEAPSPLPVLYATLLTTHCYHWVRSIYQRLSRFVMPTVVIQFQFKVSNLSSAGATKHFVLIGGKDNETSCRDFETFVFVNIRQQLL